MPPAGPKVPEQLQIRPHMKKNERLQAVRGTDCDMEKTRVEGGPDIHPGTRIQTPPASREPIFREWTAPKFSPNRNRPQLRERALSKGLEGKALEKNDLSLASLKKRDMRSRRDSSRRRADEYRALLQDVSPESPRSNPFSDHSSFEPSPMTPIAPWSEVIPSSQPTTPSVMSSRISDVLDQPPMPEIDIDTVDDEMASRLSISGAAPDHGQALTDGHPSSQEVVPPRKGSSVYSEDETSGSGGGDSDLPLKLQRSSLHRGVSQAFRALRSSSGESTPLKDGTPQLVGIAPVQSGASARKAAPRLSLLKRDISKDKPQAPIQSHQKGKLSTDSRSKGRVFTTHKKAEVKRPHKRKEELKKQITHLLPWAEEGKEF